jgi:hypothetical protein
LKKVTNNDEAMGTIKLNDPKTDFSVTLEIMEDKTGFFVVADDGYSRANVSFAKNLKDAQEYADVFLMNYVMLGFVAEESANAGN